MIRWEWGKGERRKRMQIRKYSNKDEIRPEERWSCRRERWERGMGGRQEKWWWNKWTSEGGREIRFITFLCRPLCFACDLTFWNPWLKRLRLCFLVFSQSYTIQSVVETVVPNNTRFPQEVFQSSIDWGHSGSADRVRSSTNQKVQWFEPQLLLFTSQSVLRWPTVASSRVCVGVRQGA